MKTKIRFRDRARVGLAIMFNQEKYYHMLVETCNYSNSSDISLDDREEGENEYKAIYRCRKCGGIGIAVERWHESDKDLKEE